MKSTKILKIIFCIFLCHISLTNSKRRKNKNPAVIAAVVGAGAEVGSTTLVGNFVCGALCMVGKIALNAFLDRTFGTNLTPSTTVSEPDVMAPFNSFLQTVRGKTRQQPCQKIKGNNKITNAGNMFMNFLNKSVNKSADTKIAYQKYIEAFKSIDNKSKEDLIACATEMTKWKNLGKNIEAELKAYKP
jgi:hypothetical protein